MRFAGLIAVFVATGLAGCGTAPQLRQQPQGDAGAACLTRLVERQVAFERVPDFGSPGACGVREAVRVSHGGVPWVRPAVLSCATADAVAAFEAEVMQPLAHTLFKQPVAKLHHMGTYNCRGRNGNTAGRLSEHAFGRAIDIRSIELADGTVIDVTRHWRNAGRKSEFLHDLARRACKHFSVVLTPNHDHAHRDHIHLDTGPYRLCGM